MAILKYNDDDLILVVISVLDITSYCYARIGFKFAVRDHFPDLQGKVETDRIDEESIFLLNNIDTNPVRMIVGCVSYLSLGSMRIRKVYESSYKDELLDERIQLLASKFYSEFVIDNFPNDAGISRFSEDDDEYIPGYEHNLYVYINSLVRLSGCLLDVVNDGQIDIDKVYDKNAIATRWQEDFITDQPHAKALRILLDLQGMLEEHLTNFWKFYKRLKTS